ncbi:hypothetical protein EBR21_00025 [bacterium]|nr:hypothetical protein [bacterium]
MVQSSPIETYLAAELESERCKLIPTLVDPADPCLSALRQWSVLSFLPSRLEKVQIASSLKLSKAPNGSWTVCSHLLRDQEQDVVGNAINSMTRTNVRGFAHRAFHYFKSPERPQRILYCLARYCEEADDRRIAEQLAPTLASDLSDAYLARSFNALYKHGIKSDAALKVAMELVESHIDATNMDRKAAVAAITYLFFAGSRAQIEEIQKIQDKVSIPELRRLLNWGLHEIGLLSESDDHGKNALSSSRFWKTNLSVLSPNYTGYGCFDSEQLVAGLGELDRTNSLPVNPQLTDRILRLGDFACSNWLANHPKFGIRDIQKSDPDTIQFWKQHATQNCEAFRESVLNFANSSFWHTESPELLALTLPPLLIRSHSYTKANWLSKAQSCEPKLAVNILLGLFLAIENDVMNEGTSESTFSDTLDGICAALVGITKNSDISTEALRIQILSCIVGTPMRHQGVAEVVATCVQSIGWWDIALAFLHETSSREISSTLRRFDSMAKQPTGSALDEKQILTLARTTALALLNGKASRIDEKAKQELKKFSELTEFLDPNSNVASLNTEGDDENHENEDSENVAADWSGHTVVDHPVARWGAILEVQLISESANDKTLSETRNRIEDLLIEAMRTAGHVEKRWIAKALATLGTDKAVKTLLYQGLQHIDAEFVAHTIRELLPSAHPRAQQALIRCVGRNAISDELKLGILEDMTIHNPTEILQELRTLEILRLPQHIDDAVRDAVGRVAALIDETETIQSESEQGKVVRLNGQDIDSTIRSLLPNHDQLNVDSRSALRTAEMILVQSKSWTQGGMDLSPIVNMHCKAVELVLRESFEPFTDALLRRGQLSRKLDILGYARPIPEKMQVFEDTLANLPIIRTIPYFSKFKLRKMLRGVCLYRPGKRFTLDGPKAFALFFLVVSRQICPFGLEKMLNLGFENDKDLFEYIKLIHSLQDSRNRAVHEGLTWEAKDEIESMRAQAFKIIEITLKIKKHLVAGDSKPQAGGSLGLGA